MTLLATNHAGWHVQRLTPEGWVTHMFTSLEPLVEHVFDTRESAETCMRKMQQYCRGELRVYEALTVRKKA